MAKEEQLEAGIDDMISEEEDLLLSLVPGPRIFTLNNTDQNTLLGVLLEETDDSFLVGLPSKMIALEGSDETVIVPYVPNKIFRLMKSAVVALMYLVEPFDEKYKEYLLQEGAELFPDVIQALSIKPEESEPLNEEKSALEEKLSRVVEQGGLISGSNSKH